MATYLERDAFFENKKRAKYNSRVRDKMIYVLT